MEYQPNEILEHVFKQFDDFGVIDKCSKTCARWKQITDKIFSKGKWQIRERFSLVKFKFIESFDLWGILITIYALVLL